MTNEMNQERFLLNEYNITSANLECEALAILPILP